MNIEKIWMDSIQDNLSLRTKIRKDTFIFTWIEELDLIKENNYDLFFITKSNSGKNYTLRVAFRKDNKFNLEILRKEIEGKIHSFRKVGKYCIYADTNWSFDGESGEYICLLGNDLEKSILKAQSFLIENNIPPYLYIVDDEYEEEYNTEEGLMFKEFWDKENPFDKK